MTYSIWESPGCIVLVEGIDSPQHDPDVTSYRIMRSAWRSHGVEVLNDRAETKVLEFEAPGWVEAKRVWCGYYGWRLDVCGHIETRGNPNPVRPQAGAVT